VTIEHPSWCDRERCNATEAGTGTHLSARAAVAGSVVAAWMQAPANHPDMVSVQVACAERLMTPHEAYCLGKVLTSIGRAGRKAEGAVGPDEGEIAQMIGHTQRLLVDWHRRR
jgi:hypothetical protein